MMTERGEPWPRSVEVHPHQPPPLHGAAAVVTFIGHATFLIQTAAGTIITDPIYSQRAGPFNALGPHRVRQPGVRFDDLPPIQIVLLSHNHYDHCDVRTLRALAKRFDPLVVTPLGNAKLARSAGLSRVEELDWWQPSRLSTVPVALTPAHHFSARSPFDRNRALWAGFMLTMGNTRIYFAGDSAYSPLFKDIRQRMGSIDLALIPIGAYEPRWFMHAVHMNPAEAVRAHLDLGSPSSIGMHFGTFPMTIEGIDEPLRALDEARREHHIPPEQFRVLDFGESIRLDEP